MTDILLDRRVLDPARAFSPALGATKFQDGFTGADGTTLDNHACDIPGVAVYGDLAAGSEVTNDTKLLGNTAQLSNAIVYNNAAVAFAVGDEVFADITRLNLTESLSGGGRSFGFLFCGLMATPTPTDGEYYAVLAVRTDDNTVQVLAANSSFGSTVVASGINWPLGTAKRLGCTLTATDLFTLWTEPQGGGTRTTLGTWVPTGDSLLDVAHNRVGLYATNSGNVTFNTQYGLLSVLGTATDPTGHTDFTLPYAVAVDGSEGVVQVVDAATGAVLPSTRPSPITVRVVGDASALSVYVGLQYTFEGQLSTIYLRDADHTGVPRADTRQRLQIQRARFLHADSYKYDVAVQGAERTETMYPLDTPVPNTGSVTAAVLSNNSLVTLKVRSAYPLPCWIIGMEWEGNFKARAALR